MHISSLTDAGTERLRGQETQWWPTCYFLQPIFIHIGVKVAAKHIRAPGFADRLRDVSIIRQTHHVSDLKLPQFVIQVVLSCGWRKYSAHVRLMNIFPFTKFLQKKKKQTSHSCFQLNFQAPFRDGHTHTNTLFMLQKLKSLHPVAPWRSGSQLRNRLSLQVQGRHRVWTIRWTWEGKLILKIHTGNEVVKFKCELLLCLILPVQKDKKVELDCFIITVIFIWYQFENMKEKQRSSVFSVSFACCADWPSEMPSKLSLQREKRRVLSGFPCSLVSSAWPSPWAPSANCRFKTYRAEKRLCVERKKKTITIKTCTDTHSCHESLMPQKSTHYSKMSYDMFNIRYKYLYCQTLQAYTQQNAWHRLQVSDWRKYDTEFITP